MIKSGNSQNRIILHVDMDAFYASIEQIDNPEYAGKPVIIGANPENGKGRGVVSTASYEARKFGVHSAMPISQAYKRCPHGIFIPPRMSRYIEVSKLIMNIFKEFTPLVEPLSVDEAFLDCSGTEKLFGKPQELAKLIKDKIKEKTGLTAGIGIASNKFIAKVASDLQKPDGLVVCPHGGEADFLAPLPVEKLWGAGPKTTSILKRNGLFKIGDIANADPERLNRILGNQGTHFHNLSKGIDTRIVSTNHTRKSISREHTFGIDTDDIDYLVTVIYELCEETAYTLRNENLQSKTVNLKIRLEGFVTKTRSRTFEKPIQDTSTYRNTILSMFDEFLKKDRQNKKIRLIGVGLSSLSCKDSNDDFPRDLFSITAAPSKSDKTDQILDDLKKRFKGRVKRAIFLDKNE